MPFHGARAAPVGTRSVSVKLMRRMALEKAHMRRSYLAHHSATSLIQRGDIPGAVPYVRRDDPPDDDTTTTTQPAATTTDTTQPTPTTTDTTTPSPTGGSETTTVTVTVTVTATPTGGGHHNHNGSHHKPTPTDDPNSTPTPTTTDTTQPTGTADATTSPTPTATPTDDPNTPTTTTTDTTTSPTGSSNQEKRSRFVRRHHAENEKRGSYPVPRVFPRFARDEIVRRTASEEWRVRRDEPTAMMEKRKVGKEITDENVARDEPESPTPTPTPTPTTPDAYYRASHDGRAGVVRRNDDSSVKDTPRRHGTHVDGRDVTSSDPPPPVIQRRNLIMKPPKMSPLPGGHNQREEFEPSSDVNLNLRKSLAGFAFASSAQKSNTNAHTSYRKRVLDSDLGEEDDHDAVQDDSSSTSSPRKRMKKKRAPRGYAAPEVYEHLNGLKDVLEEGLDRFTPKKVPPEEDETMARRFGIGLTNLVGRPTAEVCTYQSPRLFWLRSWPIYIQQTELSVEEQAASVPVLLEKLGKYRPKMFNSKGKLKKSEIGLQGYKIVYPLNEPAMETLFYALPSPSARVVQPQKTEKIKLFGVLKEVLQELKEGKLDTRNLELVTLENIH
ncbi:hypothetical protein H0H93_009014 [Arthromyces matolae]|nr:hypothetical protein H0H93_009014 [Arthromyces matolae]